MRYCLNGTVTSELWAIDIWSVGTTLAELFTRVPLFPGLTEETQWKAIEAKLGTPGDDFLGRLSNGCQQMFADREYKPKKWDDPAMLPDAVFASKITDDPRDVQEYFTGMTVVFSGRLVNPFSAVRAEPDCKASCLGTERSTHCRRSNDAPLLPHVVRRTSN